MGGHLRFHGNASEQLWRHFARKPKAAVYLLREGAERNWQGTFSQSQVQHGFFFFFTLPVPKLQAVQWQPPSCRVTPQARLHLNAKTFNSEASQLSACRRHLPPGRCFLKAAERWHQPPFLPLIQAALTEHAGYFLPRLTLRALLCEGIANVGTLMRSHAAFPPLFIHPRPLIPNLRQRQLLTLPSSLNKWSHQNTATPHLPLVVPSFIP